MLRRWSLSAAARRAAPAARLNFLLRLSSASSSDKPDRPVDGLFGLQIARLPTGAKGRRPGDRFPNGNLQFLLPVEQRPGVRMLGNRGRDCLLRFDEIPGAFQKARVFHGVSNGLRAFLRFDGGAQFLPATK